MQPISDTQRAWTRAAAAHRGEARGFSLLAVFFVIVMLSLLGSAAYVMSSVDASSAESTELRSQALAAAEAGLSLVAAGYPAAPPPTPAAGDEGEDGTPAPAPTAVPLPHLGGDDGKTYEYSVIETTPSGDGDQMIVEGRVLKNGSVVSRARLGGAVIIEVRDQPYSSTEGSGPQGANTTILGRPPFRAGAL